MNKFTAYDLADKNSAEWKGCKQFFEEIKTALRKHVNSQSTLTGKQVNTLLRDIGGAFSKYEVAAIYKEDRQVWDNKAQSFLHTLDAWIERYTDENRHKGKVRS